MNLVTITRDELPIGQPIPWMVFDRNGDILFEQGATLEDLDDVDALLALNPMRDSSAQPGDADSGPQTSYSFADMRLRVGDRMQLEPPSAVSAERHMVKVIGYVENISLMTTAPMANGLRVPLRDNDRVVVRIFANQNAFGFDTTILRASKIPFDYLHLEFPTRIQGAVIRKSPRIRTKLITNITQPNPAGEFHSGDEKLRHTGLILNLSADGALLQAKRPLAAKDGKVRVAFRVNLHDVDALLTVDAIVRSVFEDEAKAKESKAGAIMHGLQFQHMPPNDRLILQSMIYQKMIEHPHLLA